MESNHLTEVETYKILSVEGKTNITYNPIRTPDFTFDGGGVEVKKISVNNTIMFTNPQFKKLMDDPSIEIWIFNRGDQLIKRVSIKDYDLVTKKLAGYRIQLPSPKNEAHYISVYIEDKRLAFLDNLVVAKKFKSRSAAVGACIDFVRKHRKQFEKEMVI